jgi:hypothetical protein
VGAPVGSRSNVHKDGVLFGGLLGALLLAGAAVWLVQRQRALRADPPPISGFGSPPAGPAGAQFGWMYQTPSEPTAPTAETTPDTADPSPPRAGW